MSLSRRQTSYYREIDLDEPVTTVEDAFPDTGPLGGIYTGLQHCWLSGSRALVVACDMPLLQPTLLTELLRLAPGHDAVVPLRDGLPEPLCAVYSTVCLEPARALLERGSFKVAGIFDGIDALLVPETDWRPLIPKDARSST